MKKLTLFILILSVIGVKAQQYQSSALLELFSSEGCGSCPDADAFMVEIMHLADSTQSPVYILDYHVDIWNRSGWVDKFSDSITSRYQVNYMKKVGQQAMFTPMLFVNGQYGMPAGDKPKVGQAIYSELMEPANVQLSMTAYGTPDHKGLTVSYQVSNMLDSMQLVLVLAEKEISSKITGGENAGQTLVHHHVVRRMKTVPVKRDLSGVVSMELPTVDDLNRYVLIGFLQKTSNWHVLSTDQLYFKK